MVPIGSISVSWCFIGWIAGCLECCKILTFFNHPPTCRVPVSSINGNDMGDDNLFECGRESPPVMTWSWSRKGLPVLYFATYELNKSFIQFSASFYRTSRGVGSRFFRQCQTDGKDSLKILVCAGRPWWIAPKLFHRDSWIRDPLPHFLRSLSSARKVGLMNQLVPLSASESMTSRDEVSAGFSLLYTWDQSHGRDGNCRYCIAELK